LPIFAAAAALAALRAAGASSFDDAAALRDPRLTIRRDYQAAVTAGGEGSERTLRINNVGMTRLTPITKVMAHLPLAFLPRPPRSALVICFGMGTTFRSLLSWGIPSTAVELVPSVPGLFGFFHADAREALASPNARVVIDDGRRFLARAGGTYDVITLDPAPPMTAAGTSFLFSEEFYALARRRLAPDGIMQIWIADPVEPVVLSAFVKAVTDSFPHVRVFRSLEGWGYHCLASAAPLPAYTAAELSARLPKAAVRDLLELGPEKTGTRQFSALLRAEIPVGALIAPGAAGLRDDRPLNEYFFLRRGLAGD
jgi:spermidine synthase